MPQFEIENRAAYYKSYTDLILSGSPTPTINGVSWGRGDLTSKVSGSTDPGTDPRYKYSSNPNALVSFDSFAREYTSPFFDRGDVRNVRIASKNLLVEDSRMPDILDLHSTGAFGAGHSIWRGPSGNRLIVLFGKDQNPVTASTPVTPIPVGRVNNIEFCYSFPFEKKYEYVSKTQKTNQIFTPTYRTNTTITNSPWYIPNIDLPIIPLVAQKVNLQNYNYVTVGLTSGSGSIEYYDDVRGYYSSSPPDGTPFSGTPGNIFNVPSTEGFVGSFLGDGYVGNSAVYGIKVKSIYKIKDNPNVPTSADDWNFYGSFYPTIEGWKYGIYNGIPTKFSAVYRRGRYGQCRDMLEQRIYTKSFNRGVLESPFDTNGGVNFISGSALAGESDMYLTSSIYAATNMIEAYRVNPYGSGLFDVECRSSQPWFDNDPRVGT